MLAYQSHFSIELILSGIDFLSAFVRYPDPAILKVNSLNIFGRKLLHHLSLLKMVLNLIYDFISFSPTHRL